ncbi:MAG TPA: DMT family transporter [Gemmatimonadaceae bacterium]|nr:DMT family transporter [Gemmatimonadaceae bacterium]
MTALGIALVLTSAVLHALWNFLVKRSGASGVAFTWLFRLPAVILLAPVAILLSRRDGFSLSLTTLLWLLGSAVIHIGYFMVLQRGYQRGDLSVVYPVARGSGPLLATIAAVVLLGERPTFLASLGALVIVGGTLWLAIQTLRTGASSPKHHVPESIAYGLAVGAFIGVYTIWDKHIVTTLQVPPVTLEWALSVSIAALLTPAALADRRGLADTWRRHRWIAVIIALLSSASYILFLTALRVLPVSRAAPLRESSVLVGTLLGVHLLAEGNLASRIAAATAILLGIVLLSVG